MSPPDAALLLIVDGDNVAHRRGGEPERMRDRLVTDASTYAEQAGHDMVIVFDGHGRDVALGRLSVRFAGDETADAVVERLAHRHAGTREVMVVSSDAVVRNVAARDGVDAMSAREFCDRLGASPTPERDPGGRLRYRLGDVVDPLTRAELERLRRGGGRGA